MKRSIFCDYSIKTILEKYKNKSISPVDIAKQTIECINDYKFIYHVWAYFDPEKLLDQAKDAEKRILKGEQIRFLEGIPVGVKDIMNSIGFPTQMGSPIWKDFTSGNDARVVFNIKRVGALIPGKTVTAEFGVHSLEQGVNPHDYTRSPGTSSTGSAISIAAGMVPASLGTQTAGSIVRPASFCGIYGMKPSFGLIPRTGILKTSDTLDSVGFFTYHAEDLENVFNSVIVRGKNYPISNKALSDNNRQNLSLSRKLKIGIIFSHTWKHVDSYAQKEFLNWVKKISVCKKFIIEEVKNQDLLSDTHVIHDIIYNKCIAYYFQEEYEHGELVSSIMRDLISRGLSIIPDEYKQALKKQEEIIFLVDSFFDEYDFIISLSSASHAPTLDEVEKIDTALIWTMTYVPVVSAPVFVSSTGLPFGVQLISKRYNDFKLLKFVQYLKSIDLIPHAVNPSVFERLPNQKNIQLTV